jgi:hypothetical protein
MAAEQNASEIVEVKRAEVKDPRHSSLRFLRDNRNFLRAQLDQLRLQTTRTTADALPLDARYLRLKEMSAAIAAARDSAAAESLLTAQRDLLESVTQLGELEMELNAIEDLLALQRERLLWLEQDFLGRQETALVILLKGMTNAQTPSAIVVGEEDEVLRVELSEAQRASLIQGGIAQIYHEFVEPRTHAIAVSFAGAAWDSVPPVEVTFETARDRITFLELDAAALRRGAPAGGLRTQVWYR